MPSILGDLTILQQYLACVKSWPYLISLIHELKQKASERKSKVSPARNSRLKSSLFEILQVKGTELGQNHVRAQLFDMNLVADGGSACSLALTEIGRSL
jgi:hypothetical protein